MASLSDLYDLHQGKTSDKWASYLAAYDVIFRDFKDGNISLLEIGIQNGGSLDIYAKYFTRASHLIGCDIEPKCSLLRYDDQRIRVVVGDADSSEAQDAIFSISNKFDIIIDDGSHLQKDIIRTFARYFSQVALGGIYIIEDLHASYWAEYGGGLFHSQSSIAFFKRLVDVVNGEHWNNGVSPGLFLRAEFSCFDVDLDDALLEQIHSVTFQNSICVIRKKAAGLNRLGPRKVVGKDDLVFDKTMLIANSSSVPDQTVTALSAPDVEVVAFAPPASAGLTLVPASKIVANLKSLFTRRKPKDADAWSATIPAHGYACWSASDLDLACEILNVKRIAPATAGPLKKSVGAEVVDHVGTRSWIKLSGTPIGEDDPLRALEIEAGTLTGIPKPQIIRHEEWTSNGTRWGVLQMTVAPSPVVEPVQWAQNNASEVSDEWIGSFAGAIRNLNRVHCDRVYASPDKIRHVIFANFGRDVDLRVEEWRASWVETHWANITGPNLMLLDWERWALAPRGFDAALLLAYSCIYPDLEKRIRAAFSDDLTSPPGIAGQYAAYAHILEAIKSNLVHPALREPILKLAMRLPKK